MCGGTSRAFRGEVMRVTIISSIYCVQNRPVLAGKGGGRQYFMFIDSNQYYRISVVGFFCPHFDRRKTKDRVH